MGVDQPMAGEGPEIGQRGDGAPVAGNDVGDHPLPPLRVRPPRHAHVGRQRVLQEHGLHLGGRHVDPTGDHQVAEAVDDPQAPVGAERASVAGAQPAVAGQGRRRRFRRQPVPGRHRGPPHQDLVTLADADRGRSRGRPSWTTPPQVSVSPYVVTSPTPAATARARRPHATPCVPPATSLRSSLMRNHFHAQPTAQPPGRYVRADSQDVPEPSLPQCDTRVTLSRRSS
jgi:hypothetical protein